MTLIHISIIYRYICSRHLTLVKNHEKACSRSSCEHITIKIYETPVYNLYIESQNIDRPKMITFDLKFIED